MTNIANERKDIESMLRNFDQIRCVLFILNCAERLFKNYEVFSRRTGFGSTQSLREVLDYGWEYVLDGKSSRSGALQELKQTAWDLAPDTTEFEGVSVSSALDAAASATLLVQAIEGAAEAASSALEVAELAADSVDMYVQVQEGWHQRMPDLESKIDGHHLMQAEINTQLEVAQTLRDSKLSTPALTELRARWRGLMTSNLGQY